MHQQLIETYTSLMADLMNLPEEIAAAQSDLTKSKFSLDQCTKEMDRIEAETSLTVEGKNAEERKARLALALNSSVLYGKLAGEETGWRKDIAKLTNDVDNLTRQFTAVGYAAKLHAAMLAYLAGPGAQQPVGDVSFGMGGKTHMSNGAVTAADAADIGL